MNEIIRVATSFIGYKEGINKNNVFGKWFGLNNTSWCFIFCSYCYDKAGTSLGKGDFLKGWASVPNALKHYTTTNEITQFPQAGDLVIFGWDRKTPQHVGLFIQDLNNGSIETVEGNTSDGNPSDGGCVQRKIRDKKFVLGYIHPKVLDQQIKTI